MNTLNNTPRDYNFWVRLASVVTIVMVTLMIAAKAWAWLASGSAAMLGSLTDSLLDITASAINFFVLSYALKPADDDHRFGHGKAEALAGLGQAAFIAGSGCLLAFHGVERVINPVALTHSNLAMAVSVFAVVCTLVVVIVQRQVVKRTESVAVQADSLHYQGDILLNITVLIALALSQAGVVGADGFFAVLVAGFLLYNGWQIATQSADHLMDKELPEAQVLAILDVVKSHPDVQGLHDVRTRQSGKVKFVQLHLELDEQMELKKAHQVSDEVEIMIKKACNNEKHPEFSGEIDVTIHQDPVSLNNI